MLFVGASFASGFSINLAKKNIKSEEELKVDKSSFTNNLLDNSTWTTTIPIKVSVPFISDSMKLLINQRVDKSGITSKLSQDLAFISIEGEISFDSKYLDNLQIIKNKQVLSQYKIFISIKVNNTKSTLYLKKK